jgi:DNA repair exonuclease SbcCD ATPase subunit
LKTLVGLDFSELNAKRKALYDTRTDVNREGNRLKALLEQSPNHLDAPEEEISVSELMEELEKRRKTNRLNDAHRQDLSHHRSLTNQISRTIEETQEEITRLQTFLDEERKHLTERQQVVKLQEALVANLQDADEAEIQEQVRSAEGINIKVRANKEKAATSKVFDENQEAARSLTERIMEIDQEKEDAMAAAKFPVPGLSFDENGVLYDGLPFEQAGKASQTRISVAMCAAIHPNLEDTLIRDASLLDADMKRLIIECAEEHGLTVWLEEVNSTDPMAIVIEDGMIKDPASEAADSGQGSHA